MKTQSNNETNNAAPVQQKTTINQHGRTSKNGFTWLRLALFAAIILTIAMPAMAICTNSTSCTDTIKRLYVQPFGSGPTGYVSLFVSLTNGITYPITCSPVSGVYFRLNSTDFGPGAFGQVAFDKMYDLLLAAKNTHSIVSLRRSGSTFGAPCSIGYVVQETP